VRPILSWRPVERHEEAVLGDFVRGDGVRFTLERYPMCYRRGEWKLLVEVASGPAHHLWGCFDEADQPVRWYHSRKNAFEEAAAIAWVLFKDRESRGKTVGGSR